MALCSAPELDIGPWGYGWCEERYSYCSDYRVACEVSGGTWVGNCFDFHCEGATPITSEGELIARTTEYAKRRYDLCTAQSQLQGWLAPGATLYSPLCYGANAQAVFQHGVEVENRSRLVIFGTGSDCASPYDSGESFTLGKGRSVVANCPAGYETRTDASGELECFRFPASDTCVGNPVRPGSGNKFQREVDYRSQTPSGLAFERYFNSYGYYRPLDTAPDSMPRLGRSRRGSYEQRLYPIADSPSVLAIAWRANGAVKHFDTAGREIVHVDGPAERLQRLADAQDNTIGWLYTTRDDAQEHYDVDGRLLSIADRAGLIQTLDYDLDGRLVSVTDPFERSLAFTHDALGRIATMTDPAGGVYSYAYDAEDNLTSVTYPDANFRQYHYEDSRFPHALTGITDENGVHSATWAYDAQGRAISSEHAGGADRTTLAYNADGTTTVTDALGKQTTYRFDVIQGLSKVTGVQGHPTATCTGANKAYSYDANGFLASKTDWNGNLTAYVHDARGRETSRTEAVGTPEERTVLTEWHPEYPVPTRIVEPGKIVELGYDDNGRLVARTERAAP